MFFHCYVSWPEGIPIQHSHCWDRWLNHKHGFVWLCLKLGYPVNPLVYHGLSQFCVFKLQELGGITPSLDWFKEKTTVIVGENQGFTQSPHPGLELRQVRQRRNGFDVGDGLAAAAAATGTQGPGSWMGLCDLDLRYQSFIHCFVASLASYNYSRQLFASHLFSGSMCAHAGIVDGLNSPRNRLP